MSEHTMRISGVAKVSVVADQAVVQFIVYVQAESMEETIRLHSGKIASVLSTIQSHNIPDRDVTTLYRYGPVYKNKRDDNGEHKTYLDGYDYTQLLSVRVTDLNTLPSLIAHLAPETHLQDVAFGVSNYDELREEAISLAIMDARDRAEKRADEFGVILEQVVGYEEPVDYDRHARTQGGMQAQVGLGGGALQAAPQLPVGENEIVVTVVVTFRIR